MNRRTESSYTRRSKRDLHALTHGEGAVETFRCLENSDRLVSEDVAADQHLDLRGWALSGHPRGVFDRVDVVIDDIDEYPVTYGGSRQVIANRYGNEQLTDCGFHLKLPVAALGPGSHRATFVGTAGERSQIFGDEMTFNVLAKPDAITRVSPSADLPGRLRTVRGTLELARHDGRAAAAIQPGASLLIDGWYAASTQGDPPDEIAIILVGTNDIYRARTRRHAEPEAGVPFGAQATACGFQTCIDCSYINPGAYRIIAEVTQSAVRSSVVSDVWVEIMADTSSWFPIALPIYQYAPATTLEADLLTQVHQFGTLLISGSVLAPEPVSGVYARFDREITYTLTYAGARFAGLMHVQLPIGTHELEILALDRSCSGAWLLTRHMFEVTRNTIGGAAAVGPIR